MKKKDIEDRLTYEELLEELYKAPGTYFPSLLSAIVRIGITKKIFKKGSAATIAQMAEDKMASNVELDSKYSNKIDRGESQ